ncbi:MAG TPA: rod shape-determining protein [Candidatus Paceibacterota bacterium]|jgi:rod shape-determining protein MreB|nr:rod shape-determining protein [Candidatus Paceibacterota bacterium]
MKIIKDFTDKFSNEIGIDLGTANTLVYLKDHGVVISEPSVVAVNQKTNRIVAVGAEAKQMMGRTPTHIKVIRPLVEGVISDFEITEEMLSYLINKAEKISKKFFKPRVVIGVPSGITNVEARAVFDAARSAGARDVYIIEEPMAGAIGVRLPIFEPVGSMVIDIGGGTSDIAVISLGGIVRSKNLRIAGDVLNKNISDYIRDEFNLLIGEKTAEQVKISAGNVMPGAPIEIEVRGRDIVTGLPRQVVVTDTDIREAISASISSLIDAVKEVLETTPPEILSDIMHRGIVLMGGGALLSGLDTLLQNVLRLPVKVADDPLTAVARGTGIIFEDINLYRGVLLQIEDDLPSR